MPGPAVGVGGLLIRGAGIALRGVGKALTRGGKSLAKAGSKKSQAQRKKFRSRRKPKKSKNINDPGLLIPLGLTGAASVALRGKQVMDDRKKNRTGGR